MLLFGLSGSRQWVKVESDLEPVRLGAYLQAPPEADRFALD